MDRAPWVSRVPRFYLAERKRQLTEIPGRANVQVNKTCINRIVAYTHIAHLG